MNYEFYVGYHGRCPDATAKLIRRVLAGVALATLAVIGLIASRQNRADIGVFEYGVTRSFEGVLYERPLPMLRLTGANGLPVTATNLLLVGFGKHGLPGFALGHDGKKVRFNGTLIYRDKIAMVEMNDAASFQVLGDPLPGEPRRTNEPLGTFTLTGELVDTKCWFGVMRPATGKIHRACAVRCLSGGAPPGLLLRDEQGNAAVVLLASPDDRPLACDPEWAARAVKVTGALEWREGVPVLRIRSLVLVAPEAGRPGN